MSGSMLVFREVATTAIYGYSQDSRDARALHPQRCRGIGRRRSKRLQLERGAYPLTKSSLPQCKWPKVRLQGPIQRPITKGASGGDFKERGVHTRAVKQWRLKPRSTRKISRDIGLAPIGSHACQHVSANHVHPFCARVFRRFCLSRIQCLEQGIVR